MRIKKVTAFLLALCLMAAVLPGKAFAAGETSGDYENIHWYFDVESKTLTISGTGSMPDGSGSLPFREDYKDVVTSIIIEPGLTSIAYHAFAGFKELTFVSIPEGIEEIGADAFILCENLDNLVLPNSLKRIGAYAFNACDMKLDSVVIPPNVEYIGDYAFHACYSLSEVTFLGDPPEIGKEAFHYSGYDTYTGKGTDKVDMYYPKNNEKWTDDKRPNWQYYNGQYVLNWVPYYNVINGNDYSWDPAQGDDVSITIDADNLQFMSVSIDIKQISSENYTVASGSTIITFRANYLRTLRPGKHQVTAHFSDGAVGRTTLTICSTAGDINGDGEMDNRDLITLARYLSKYPVDVNKDAVDVNGDGQEDNRDVLILAQFLANWNVEIY